ncbi:pleckstrin homology domain-containing family A member 8 isoform X2 [Cyprinodon tularosa]|uniref:pleckstrin homology domain-containing family A member 8 isoform X2 n=1 Tax=Cyprinodon tularosa TaxID=77115 RepID=UPI0018E2048B|nr:pleckstrin homology domain-containing family A member 8 isoform X2 [Cyprinodon tularosa]
MEGMLHKWTNYISGWQPRWFVLDEGTLSYYDSQEDAWKGCKGSIKISVCEIQVHSSDSTRVDLIIPGEQYFYLRAINAAERQKWLVALGTAKACLTDNRTKREKELQENTEALKTKMSELRLYCDLLLQQVNKIKENDELGETAESGIDTGNMVKSTCTTFLKTLEECMQIANRTFNTDLGTHSPPGTPPVAAIKPLKLKHANHSNRNLGENLSRRKDLTETSAHDTLSLDSGAEGPDDPDGTGHHPPPSDIEPSIIHGEQVSPAAQITQRASEKKHYDLKEEEDDQKENDRALQRGDQSEEQDHEKKENARLLEHQRDPALDQEESPDQFKTPSDSSESDTEQVDTFFNTMSHRFSDMRLDDDNGIPSQEFLDSCYAIVPVLDKLGSTVFAPVKMDFVGNIKKIQQKLMSDPDSFPTLQSIVLHEVQTNVAQVRNSATEALLWLRRGLKFLKEFLSGVNAGEKDIQAALNNAYGKTLRQYHGWVVRGVFALALRAAPTYQSFTAALVSREGDELRSDFTKSMHRDLGVYLPAMEKQLAILDELYEEYNLESDEVV